MECEYCDGIGTYEYEECPYCYGTGWIDEDDDSLQGDQ